MGKTRLNMLFPMSDYFNNKLNFKGTQKYLFLLKTLKCISLWKLSTSVLSLNGKIDLNNLSILKKIKLFF